MRVLLVSILLLIAAGQSRSAAQASPPEPAAVVATIRPGSFIRVTLPNGQRITGRYTFAGLGRLGIQQLDHRTDSLRFDAIRGLAVRGRHTKTGAIVGGIAGAGFGIFVGLVSNALCEGGGRLQRGVAVPDRDSGLRGRGIPARCSGGFSVSELEAGAAMSTRVVALLAGLGFVSPLTAQLPTGEIRVHAIGAFAPRVSDTTGYGYLPGPPDGAAAAGVSADLSFIAGRFRLGPEAFILRGPSRQVWSLGGVGRYEVGAGNARPFGVFGAGAYFWSRKVFIDLEPEYGGAYWSWQSDVNYFSMSVGGGVAVGAPAGRLALSAEFRAHRSFQSGGGAGIRSLLSLGVGGRLLW